MNSSCFYFEFILKMNWIFLFFIVIREFVEKFQYKLDWGHISANQKLSEKFIEKYKDKVCWYHISKYQKLSLIFIEKFQFVGIIKTVTVAVKYESESLEIIND